MSEKQPSKADIWETILPASTEICLLFNYQIMLHRFLRS